MKMGYVDNNLMAEETVVYTGNIHWFIFLPGLILFFLGTIFFLADVLAPLMGTIVISFGIVSLILKTAVGIWLVR